MSKQLLISLLLYTTLTTSTINASNSADEFFAEAKKNPDISVLAPIFNNLPPEEQQKISVQVQTQNARALGITANLYFVLKDYLQNGKFLKSATPSVIAILHKEQEKASASKQTTQNQETDAQKLHKEFEAQRKQREAAEEQLKQTELFNAKLADLQNKESTDRATIANDASLEKFKPEYDQSLADAKNAEAKRKQTELFNTKLANLENAETAKRIEMENAAQQHANLQDTYTKSLAEAKNAEAKRKQTEALNSKLVDLQKTETANRAAIANNLSLENSERNELSRRFQTEKIRLEEEQQKKASEAIAAALAEVRLSMEIQLQDYLKELNKIRDDLLKKLQAEQSEVLKAELKKKEQELTELTKQVNEIQQETLIAHDTAKVFGTYVADTIIENFARLPSKSTEAQQFKSIIDTQNFEQIISKIKEFLQKGMIENDPIINQSLQRALTIHGARLDRIDNIKRKIANLKQ